MYSEEFQHSLNELCIKKSQDWDHKLYYKKHHSNGMCVKVLFEILAQISPVHKVVYEKIKGLIWSQYLVMIYKNNVITEFKKYGMKKVKVPMPGAFLFFKKGNYIGHIGLCIDNKRFWHMCKQGFVCENISAFNIAFIGVF